MIRLTVNGTEREVEAPPLARLLDVLRGPMGLTGAKENCAEGEHGTCGACTVLLDGVPVNACLVAAGQCAGKEVVTVEGLKLGDALSPLARCLADNGGAECGLCTSGIMVAAEALLGANPRPSADEVRDAIAGNRCTCTTSQRVVDAILQAAASLPAPERRRSMFPPGVKA